MHPLTTERIAPDMGGWLEPWGTHFLVELGSFGSGKFGEYEIPITAGSILGL